jgi:cytochrome b involved in lipid metabolism
VTSMRVNRKLSLTLCLSRDVKVYDSFTFLAKHQGNTHNSYNLSDTTKNFKNRYYKQYVDTKIYLNDLLKLATKTASHYT